MLAKSGARGRLRIRSITLPMYMLATSPQNTSGWVLSNNGPGCMPYRVSAPSITAVVPEPGMPSAISGTSAPVEAGIVRGLGRCHALDDSRAELLRAPGYALLGCIGEKRCDRRARAGQHADEKTDHRASADASPGISPVLPRRQQPAQLGFDGLEPYRPVQIEEQFTDGEQADGNRKEVEPVEQVRRSRTCSAGRRS